MSKFAKFAIQTSDLPADFGEKKEGAQEQKNWSFKPGLHEDVVIESAEIDEVPCKGDPTWLKCKLNLRKGNHLMRNMVLIPTQRLMYIKEEGAAGTAVCFDNLARFLQALGVDLNKNNAGDVIPAVFGDPSVLVGLKVNAVIGHSKYYAHYVDKNTYHLYSRNDQPVCHKGTKNPMEFPAAEAAQMFCTEQLGEEFSMWPEVKKYQPPTTGNSRVLSTKAIEKPAKKTKNVEW